MFLWILCSLYNSCKWPTWRTFPFSVCLFQFSTCSEQPRAHHQENQWYQNNIWYVSFWPSSVQVGKELPDLHTRRSPTQSDTYQMLYWYNWFSWWWVRGCSKHVENWNKYIEKGTVRQIGHLQEVSVNVGGFNICSSERKITGGIYPHKQGNGTREVYIFPQQTVL
jgi:hypothetical protein